MRRLATPEELSAAENAFHLVFEHPAGAAPFRPRLAARTLIYPLDVTDLTEVQFEALRIAAAGEGEGEARAYYAGFGRSASAWGGTYDHSLLDFDSFEDYREDPCVVIEHALFSVEGRWGLVGSDQMFAVAAGSARFRENFLRHLPEAEDHMLWEMLKDYLDLPGAARGWVPQLLEHLRGPEEGARIWNDAQPYRRD